MEIFKFNELLERVKEDSAALTELYNYYSPRMMLHIKSKYPGVPSEDIVHEFFMFLLKEKIPLFVANPDAWVYTVCDNMSKRYIRDNWDVEPNELEPIADIDLISKAMDDEAVKEIFSLIEDENDKKIIYYVYWLNYSSFKIEKILGIKSATIRQRHSRLIKKIQNYLNSVTDDEE